MRRGVLSFRKNDVSANEDRTVIAAGGDEETFISGLLGQAGLPFNLAGSIGELCHEIASGAGAAIVAEEILTPESMDQLGNLLAEQPSWSDFPVIMLTKGGDVTAEAESEHLGKLRLPIGKAFLLERPFRPETLLSTLGMALQARRRQYQIRDQIQQNERVHEALRRSEKQAVTGRLMASIAHEINNPLEAVTNLLYLMRNDERPEKMHQYLGTAEQELARAVEITRQTLRFYREPSQPVETDLAAVIHSVLTLFHSRLMAAGIEVRREILVSSASVFSSPGELRQVIANIVGNAIDAMRSGGRLHVRISSKINPLKTNQERIHLTIADTGSGIPADVLPTIFEPFMTTKGETGTGLGLWVTREIVKKNGWSIRVHSNRQPGRSGTVFSIIIPIRKTNGHSQERLSA